MMRCSSALVVGVGLTGAGLLLTMTTSAAPALEPWGAIKGRVVWVEKDLPEPKEITITKDKDAIKECLKGGKLLEENWVVDKNNRGVRWVLVWLAPAKADDPNGKPAPLPIHPDLREIKKKEVMIDMPCGRFEPHLLGLRKGQVLVVNNSSTIFHDVKLDGGPEFESSHGLIPPNKDYKREDLRPPLRVNPLMATSSIHPWMRAWIGVFDHPYFAVTDADGKFEIKNAPAGEWRLYIWHEETGWLNKGKRDGEPITIKAEQTKDLREIEAKQP